MVYVWEALTGRQVQVYDDPVSDDGCLAWSPDGRFLAAGGYHSVHVWRCVDQRCVAQYAGFRFGPTAVAWSPDGRQLAQASGTGNLHIRDVDSGHLLWRAKGHLSITDVAYSPDGQWLASSGYDATVQVRESRTGKLVQVYRGHPPGHVMVLPDVFNPQQMRYWYPTVVWSLAWSPDSRYLASSSGNIFRAFMHESASLLDIVHIWEALTGWRIFPYLGHTQEVRQVAWSPDGRLLASDSCDQTVQVWSSPV